MNCQYDFDHEIWNRISYRAKDFVSELLELDAEKRLTGENALKHEWLRQHSQSIILDDEFMSKVQKRIEYHADSNLLKRIGLSIIAHKSSAEEIMKLRQAFRRFDTNNDGVISFSDFKLAMEKFGHTDSEVKEIFDKMVCRGISDVLNDYILVTLHCHFYSIQLKYLTLIVLIKISRLCTKMVVWYTILSSSQLRLKLLGTLKKRRLQRHSIELILTILVSSVRG